MERREVCAENVRGIIANCRPMADRLAHYYPCIGERMLEPIPAGVSDRLPRRAHRTVPRDGGVIGFIGKEWKRKGLDIAVSAVARLREQRPSLELWVAGPDPHEVRSLVEVLEPGVRLLGWREAAEVYRDLDVLIHPAREEPYGMVIAEANAAGVPVVVSERCGIAPEIDGAAGVVLPVDAGPERWASACESALARSDPVRSFARSWRDVAVSHVRAYRAVLARGPHSSRA